MSHIPVGVDVTVGLTETADGSRAEGITQSV